jgi:hypothetical protein
MAALFGAAATRQICLCLWLITGAGGGRLEQPVFTPSQIARQGRPPGLKTCGCDFAAPKRIWRGPCCEHSTCLMTLVIPDVFKKKHPSPFRDATTAFSKDVDAASLTCIRSSSF